MKTICLMLGTIIFLCDPVEAKDFKFPEVMGWKLSGEVQTFMPNTLYEYINGAADLYLMYDFEELNVAEFQNEKKASITVDVYRHRTPTHAFGIYSQERFSNANFLNIGVQGYYENGFLNFLMGTYYIKISSYNTGAEDQNILVTFAKRVAENLGERGSFPNLLSSFPSEGKRRNSEKFIAKNFLGYSFLHSAFTADYELSGTKFKLFVVEVAERDDGRDMIQKYLQQTKSPDKKIVEGHYTISDRYHGEIELHWQGKYIWGTLSLNDPTLRSKYVKLLGEGIESNRQKK